VGALVRKRRQAWLGILTATLTLLILAEYTFALPYVYSDAPVPEFYEQVRQEGGEGAIADHPLNTGVIGDAGRFARPLYYQTAHGRPIAGGKSWRIIEEGRGATRLVHALIAPDDQVEPDIYPAVPDRERAAWLSELGFQYVVLHKHSTSNIYDWRDIRAPEKVALEKEHLSGLLSAPLYEDQWIVAFEVPGGEPLGPGARPLLAFSHGWTDASVDAQGRLRREMARTAALDVYAPAPHAYRLAFEAYSLDGPREITVSLDGRTLLTTTLDREQPGTSPAFDLPAGQSTLVFESPAPCKPHRQPCQPVAVLRLDLPTP
jgi:hypothetical protein